MRTVNISSLAALTWLALVIAMLGMPFAVAVASTTHTNVTRNQRVVIEIDPNDNGTALYHCHSHAITGAGRNTYVFTHCKHGS